MKNIPIILVFCLFLAVSADAQRTGGFRRLQIDDNVGSMSWIISNQSSLGIDETGATTGTFPNTNAMLTLGAGTKGNALDLQTMLGGTGILFSQNQPLTGIDMSLGTSGTGLIIDGATPLGISIGLISAGSDGMTIDATNSGISIGNGTAPSNGMNIEATSTGLAIGTATLPDIGQTTEANLIGGTFDAGDIGVDVGQVTTPLLGLGVLSQGTGIDVSDNAFIGTGINVTMNNFIGTGINIQDNTFGGTGLNVNAGFGSTGINVNGGTNNVLVVNGTADATLLSVGADPVWDARINGDLHVSGETKFGGSIYVDGTTPNNHSILANDDFTIGTNAPGQNFNLVAGLGGMINITAPIMFPPLPSLSDLDMGNFRILNIGNAGTDFTAAGGLILADNLTIGNIPALSLSTDVLVTNAGVVQQRTAASLISGSAWALNGNALTGVLPAAPVERFGSTNGADVIMMTGGAEQMRLRSSGGINIPSTTAAGVGAIYQNGILFTHSFGFQQYFAGIGVGNLSMGGGQNTAVGFASMGSTTTGQQNTALGNSALRNNQSGSYNTAVGLNALQLNVSGVNNTAVGLGALLNNTASNNTAVGFEALTANMGGTQNTAMGVVALQKNTSGSSNTANGFAALQNNVTGSNNTALGYGTLANGGSMNNSTAVGTAALISTSGDDNTAVGYASLQTTSTGTGNTGIGKFAGTANLTGSNNTFAGNNANPSANNLTNATAIGANATVNASNKIQLGDGAVTRVATAGSVSIRNVDYVWPAADGAGVLMSNGALALSWNNNPTLGGLTLNGNLDMNMNDIVDLGDVVFSQATSNILNSVGNVIVNDVLEVTGNVVPTNSLSYSLGTDALRWAEAYIGGTSVHIGPSGGEAGNTEMNVGYNGGLGTINVDGGANEIVVSNSNTSINTSSTGNVTTDIGSYANGGNVTIRAKATPGVYVQFAASDLGGVTPNGFNVVHQATNTGGTVPKVAQYITSTGVMNQGSNTGLNITANGGFAANTGIALNVTGNSPFDMIGTVGSWSVSNAGLATLSSLVVTGTSDLRGNISNSTGNVTVSDALDVTGVVNVSSSITNGGLGGSGLVLNDDVLLQGLAHFNGNANFNNQGQLNFKELSVNGLNQISFRAPAAVTADVLFTLPSDGGTAGQVLSTSGGATPTLSWVPAGSGWSLTGNNLTGGTPSTPNEWFGSSNNYDVIFRSANTERMRIASTGNVGIGSTSPFTQLTMPGSVPSGAVGTVATNNNPIGIAVSGRYAYITTESGSLQVIDVSNPAAMVVEGTLAGLGGQPRQLCASGRYAYVANEGGGTLQIIDVSNPNTPTLAGSIAAASCNSVHVVGRYAYATSYSGNVLRIIDVSNPSAPVQLSTVATGINPAFVYVNGRYAFVAAEGANQLECYDVSNPTSPTFVSGIGTGMTNPYCVNVSDKYAYVIDWIGGLFVVDVSNPAAMSVVGTLANPAFYLHASGHKVYTVDNGTTLRTIDVSNPASPTSVGTSTAGNSAFAVYSAGRYVYVCNRSSNTVTAYDMGGAYVEAMESGNLEASRIQVRNDINVNGDIAAKGGIVAGTAEFHGGVGIANGGFKVASAGVTVVANAATINAAQASAFIITSDNNGTNDNITINGGVEGQTLYIFYNHTAGNDDLVVPGTTVVVNNASHAGVTMLYIGGAWRVTGSYLY